MLPEKVLDRSSLSTKRAVTYEVESYVFYGLHFYLMRSTDLQSFLLIPLLVSELYPGQSSMCKNEDNAMTK